jgi:hypothetical protein
LNKVKDVTKGVVEIVKREGSSFLRKLKKCKPLTLRRSHLAHPHKM